MTRFLIMLSLILSAVAFADTPPPVYTFTLPLLKTGVNISANIFGVSTSGIVPASGGGTSNFLRADGSWASPGSTPTGSNNTLAYFNSSGVLSSNANYRLNDANGWLVLSTLGTGSTTGNVGATGGAGMVIGNVAGTSSILSTSTGNGQLAVGQSLSNGQVSAQGNGSAVVGYASNAGIVATELDGSLAVGRADTSGQVAANGKATIAFGYADGSSILGAVGNGSQAMGYATSNSNLVTTTGKFGQFAGGYAATSADLITSGNGAFTYGYCDSASGSIAAAGDGSLAIGRAHGAVLSASGTGAIALGYASSFNVTASGDGSFAAGNTLTAANTATNTSAFAFGDGNASSGILSTSFGLGNANGSYGTLVAGRYASISGTSGSWVATDPLFVLGNGTGSGAKANAFSVLKNGTTTINGAVTGTSFTGQMYAPNGSVSAPGFAFTSETNSGLYRVGTGELGLAVVGAQVFDLQKSTGGFGNVGMGGSASVSDNYPLLIQRSGSSVGTNVQISNPETAPNSYASIQVAADAGNVVGLLSAYTSSSTVPAYISAMVVRPDQSGHHLSLMGGSNAGDDVSIWTNGDFTASGQSLLFPSDHSIQFMQEIATPATPAASTDKIYAKSDHNIYHLTPSGTELKLLDSSYSPAVATQTPSGVITVSTSLTFAYTRVYVNCSVACTITLPDATVTPGFELAIKNIGTTIITVNTVSSQTIDGASTATINYQNNPAVMFSAANGGWNVF